MNTLKFPLSNVQMELLRLFDTDLSDSELWELKTVLSHFYADKAIKIADEIWDRRGLTNDDMDSLLNGHS